MPFPKPQLVALTFSCPKFPAPVLGLKRWQGAFSAVHPTCSLWGTRGEPGVSRSASPASPQQARSTGGWLPAQVLTAARTTLLLALVVTGFLLRVRLPVTTATTSPQVVGNGQKARITSKGLQGARGGRPLFHRSRPSAQTPSSPALRETWVSSCLFGVTGAEAQPPSAEPGEPEPLEPQRPLGAGGGALTLLLSQARQRPEQQRH